MSILSTSVAKTHLAKSSIYALKRVPFGLVHIFNQAKNSRLPSVPVIGESMQLIQV